MIRFFDLIFSIFGILILFPVLFILSIWIKLDSKGPIFYKQKRVGKDNIDFFLYKFRSMRTGSDKQGLLTIGGKDPRITRSGYFIRKYKLDELPQLINVFKGEMSLVGPRPEVRKYVDLYSEEQRRILAIRPGITDYASIDYANENELLMKFEDPEKGYINIIMPEKIQLNLKYINNYNLIEYFRIIILTLIKIIRS